MIKKLVFMPLFFYCFLNGFQDEIPEVAQQNEPYYKHPYHYTKILNKPFYVQLMQKGVAREKQPTSNPSTILIFGPDYSMNGLSDKIKKLVDIECWVC